jgi:hypothetical protein
MDRPTPPPVLEYQATTPPERGRWGHPLWAAVPSTLLGPLVPLLGLAILKHRSGFRGVSPTETLCGFAVASVVGWVNFGLLVHRTAYRVDGRLKSVVWDVLVVISLLTSSGLTLAALFLSVVLDD